MALASTRSRDPILESLSEVGTNIRALSGDILTRRRIDLSETKEISEAERERNLQSLKAQALQQEGQVKVLETTGKLAEVGHRMELDQKKFGMEEKRFGLDTQKHELQQRLGESQIKETEALLPGKIAEQNANVIARRASAAAATSGARVNNLQAQELEGKIAMSNKPMSPAALAGMAKMLGGDDGLDFVTKLVDPNEKLTTGYGMYVLKMMDNADPERSNNVMLNALAQKIPGMPDGPEKDLLIQERQNRLQNAGKLSQGKAPNYEEAFKMTYDQLNAELSKAVDSGDAFKVKALVGQLEVARQNIPAHFNPDQAQKILDLEHPAIKDFQVIATQTVDAMIQKEGTIKKDSTQYVDMVQSLKYQLAREHGTPEAYKLYQRQLAAEKADQAAKSRPGRPASGTPADAPMTPRPEGRYGAQQEGQKSLSEIFSGRPAQRPPTSTVQPLVPQPLTPGRWLPQEER